MKASSGPLTNHPGIDLSPAWSPDCRAHCMAETIHRFGRPTGTIKIGFTPMFCLRPSSFRKKNAR